MARQLIIELIGDHKKLTKSLDEAGKQTSSFGNKIGAAGKKMTAFATVPIVGFLGAATKAAAEDAAAQDHLAKTLSNTIGNSKQLVTQVESYVTKAMKASTFTDDELRPAFETFATTTRNVDESQRLLGIAMDVAAGKGISLETATLAVAKAHAGQFTAVNRLIPGLVDVSDKTLTADKVTAKLAATFSGQAAAATETAAGKAQMMTRDLGELAESIGGQLLPIADKLVSKLTSLLSWLNDSGIGADKLTYALLGIAAAGPVLKGIELATKGVAAAQWAWNAAVTANPLVVFVGAVVGLAFWLDRVHGSFKSGISTLTSWDNTLDEIAGRVSHLLDLLRGLGDRIRNLPGSGLLKSVLTLGGKLPGFAMGGTVPGAPGMPVPILAHGGEQVVPRNRVASSGGGTSVVVNVGGSVITERDLGRIVADALRNNALIGVS